MMMALRWPLVALLLLLVVAQHAACARRHAGMPVLHQQAPLTSKDTHGRGLRHASAEMTPQLPAAGPTSLPEAPTHIELTLPVHTAPTAVTTIKISDQFPAEEQHHHHAHGSAAGKPPAGRAGLLLSLLLVPADAAAEAPPSSPGSAPPASGRRQPPRAISVSSASAGAVPPGQEEPALAQPPPAAAAATSSQRRLLQVPGLKDWAAKATPEQRQQLARLTPGLAVTSAAAGHQKPAPTATLQDIVDSNGTKRRRRST